MKLKTGVIECRNCGWPRALTDQECGHCGDSELAFEQLVWSDRRVVPAELVPMRSL